MDKRFTISIFASFGSLLFFSILFGQISFSKRTIDSNFINSKKLVVIDLDQDGDLDVVGSANDNTSTPTQIAWWENDGTQNFTRNTIASNFGGARTVTAGDLDGDGDIDVVGGRIGTDELRWWEKNGSIWTEHILSSYTDSVYSIKIVDLDKDTDNDLLVTYAKRDSLLWFENDGAGSFTPRVIATSFLGVGSVGTGLINGDGFLDVVGGAFFGDEVRWWQNDGTPSDGGWISNLIESNLDGFIEIDIADVNSDGYPDVLGAVWLAQKILWWQNDGNGNFGASQTIVTGYQRARSVQGIDVDGDSDVDIIGAADDLNTISWWENDGSQNFTRHDITNSFTYTYYAEGTDLDGDGDIDIVASAQNANEVAWFESHAEDKQFIAAGDAPATSFWNSTVIMDFLAGTGDSVAVFFDQNKVPNPTSLGAGIDHVASRGFYTITTNKSSYNCDIIFDYGQQSLWSPIDNPSQLVMVFWDPTPKKWVEVGTQSVDVVNKKITVSGLTSQLVAFSHWTIGSRTTDNPLPVELIAFNGYSTSSGIELVWTTGSEINNLGFEIWRAEGIDSQFVLIADYNKNENLKGAGNSNTSKNYSYLDNMVLPSMKYYYKLVDVDFNGDRNILGQISVVYEFNTIIDPVVNVRGFELEQNYPNPFNGVTTIPIVITTRSEGIGRKGLLQIFDLTGKKIQEFELSIDFLGRYSIEWDGTDQFNRHVASGYYLYRFILGSEIQTRKLIYLK